MFDLMFSVFNDLGTFAFALSGARQLEADSRSATLRSLIYAGIPAFLTAFGGGLTRDVLVLRRTPGILSSQEAVVVMVVTYLLYAALVITDRRSILKTRGMEAVLTVTDAIGDAAFIQCGAEAAFGCGAGAAVAVLTGLMTAIGGGMLAGISAGKRPMAVLRSVPGYRLAVLFHSLLYVALRSEENQGPLTLALALSCILFFLLREFFLRSDAPASRRAAAGREGFTVSRGALFQMIRRLIFKGCGSGSFFPGSAEGGRETASAPLPAAV